MTVLEDNSEPAEPATEAMTSILTPSSRGSIMT